VGDGALLLLREMRLLFFESERKRGVKQSWALVKGNAVFYLVSMMFRSREKHA
jgi:hypothetical protein